MYSKIGPVKVTLSALAIAPSRIVEKAMKAEHDKKWQDAYVEVNEQYLVDNANIVSSHAIFMAKKDDMGYMKLRGSIFVHGNHDSDRDTVRAYFAAADMAVIMIHISILS